MIKVLYYYVKLYYIIDIVYLKYTINGDIYFKTDLTKDWEMSQKKLRANSSEPKTLYSKSLSITELKLKDLQYPKQVKY